MYSAAYFKLHVSGGGGVGGRQHLILASNHELYIPRELGMVKVWGYSCLKVSPHLYVDLIFTELEMRILSHWIMRNE